VCQPPTMLADEVPDPLPVESPLEMPDELTEVPESLSEELAAARAEAAHWRERAEAAESRLADRASELRRHQECIATLRAARWSSLPIAAAAAEEATASATASAQCWRRRLEWEADLLAGELLTTEHSLQDASAAAFALGLKAEEYLTLLASAPRVERTQSVSQEAATPAASTEGSHTAASAAHRGHGAALRESMVQTYGRGPHAVSSTLSKPRSRKASSRSDTLVGATAPRPLPPALVHNER